MSMLVSSKSHDKKNRSILCYNIYPNPDKTQQNTKIQSIPSKPDTLLHEKFPYSHYSIAKLYGRLRREMRGIWNGLAEDILASPGYTVVRMARELNIQVEAATKILIGQTVRPRFETSLRLLCLHIMLFPARYVFDGEHVIDFKQH